MSRAASRNLRRLLRSRSKPTERQERGISREHLPTPQQDRPTPCGERQYAHGNNDPRLWTAQVLCGRTRARLDARDGDQADWERVRFFPRKVIAAFTRCASFRGPMITPALRKIVRGRTHDSIRLECQVPPESGKGGYAKKPSKKNGNIRSCIFIFLTEQGVHAPTFQLAKQGTQRRCGIGQDIA